MPPTRTRGAQAARLGLCKHNDIYDKVLRPLPVLACVGLRPEGGDISLISDDPIIPNQAWGMTKWRTAAPLQWGVGIARRATAFRAALASTASGWRRFCLLRLYPEQHKWEGRDATALP
jgi:hypothetical protein